MTSITEPHRGRAYVITGAASGIGRAQVVALSERGAEVWAVDINADELNVLSKEYGVHTAVVDVTSPAQWAELRSQIEEAGTALDGLVNNAGTVQREPIRSLSPAAWQRVLDINLTSVLYAMQAIEPLLSQRGGGSIVNISSVAGQIGWHQPGYAASKAGVKALTKTAALEFADSNIRVNSVHPGLVETPLSLTNPRFEEYSTAWLDQTPLGRVGRPSDVNEVVLFLLSEASGYMTGSEVVVDGGFTSSGALYRVTHDPRPPDPGQPG